VVNEKQEVSAAITTHSQQLSLIDPRSFFVLQFHTHTTNIQSDSIVHNQGTLFHSIPKVISEQNMPSSKQRTRSGKSGAKAPQPDADASAEITEIKQLLNLADIDDSDHAQMLLNLLDTLQTKSFDLSTLDDDLIRNILKKFNVTNKGKTSTLLKKLKLIIVSGVCISCYLFRLLRHHLIKKYCFSVFTRRISHCLYSREKLLRS
jgi:hypothetical protein